MIALRGEAGLKMKGSAGIYLRGIALNARQTIAQSSGLDIRIAQESGYIIADASGVVGFNPLNPGQRDPGARLVRDKDGRIGDEQ